MNSNVLPAYAGAVRSGFTKYSITVSDGTWEQQDNGTWKYRLKSDAMDYAVSCWQKDNGRWYHFDENGIMQTGFIIDNGRNYYLRPDGAMAENEVCIVDGSYYSFDADGNYHVTWYQDGAAWKYAVPGGGCVTDAWKEIDGKFYHFDSAGNMQTGFLSLGDKTYYLKPAGDMAAGETLVLNGIAYTFDADGACDKTPDEIQAAAAAQAAAIQAANEARAAALAQQAAIQAQAAAAANGNQTAKGTQSASANEKQTAEQSADSVQASSETNAAVNSTAASEAAVSVTAQSSSWPYKAITYVPSDSEKSAEYKLLDSICDSILSGIVNNGMTKRQKAEAIYAYVRGHFTYSGHSATRDWVHEAYQGLRSKHGDCFTYYASAQALLTRVGINCIEVIRSTDADHWWEMVEVEDGWWHFDTTPRKVGGYYCLWSDAQMDSFSAAHGNCFAFDHSLYPRTP